MWNDVVSSNVKAYAAAIEVNKRLGLPEGREDFHTLSWLEYANLMLGKLDDARANVELARAAAERNPDNAAVREGYLAMRARYMLETGQWERVPVEREGGHAAHGAMPGMAMADSGGTAWLFAAGAGAAKLGDAAAADAVVAAFRTMKDKSAAEGNAYRAKVVDLLESEVAALAASARGQQDAALRFAKEAADVELTLSPPSGPPDPIKPAHELYGDLLLDANRPRDAAAAFTQSLLRTPKRTPSLLGLARAAARSGDMAGARRAYTLIVEMPGVTPAAPAVGEARSWLASNEP
jgi:hypothetical protein